MAKRKPSCVKKLLRLAILGTTSYIAILSALIYFPELQPALTYLHWVRIPFGVDWNDGAVGYGFRASTVRNVKIHTSDNVTLGAWHVLPRTSSPSIFADTRIAGSSEDRFDAALESADRVFLYFHGNSGNRATGHRTKLYKMIQQLGSSHIIAVDYRGFADSDPVYPTEAGVQRDAEATFQWVLSKGIPQHKIFLIGHSLGTGVASYLAHRVSNNYRIGGVILLAPYASMSDAAIGYPIVPLLWPFKHHPATTERVKGFVSERWNSTHYLRETPGVPLLLVTGSRDFEILPWQARSLFTSSVSARLSKDITVPKENVGTALAKDHPKEVTRHDGYVVRPLVRDEGWLWVADRGENGDRDDVWYLEVKHGGHNSVASFQVVEDTLKAFVERK
ncbi:Alpha/Beta hydrolase protein [Fimicolochytrium jonesii]|uniref:Alpha/Beta hydrolase protein n=1 Tax=Fimicolochytrium jonesii TaxID=1396493 RepID=UPI0022FE7F4F|nr:Alpha/Beta hydrolase protein [Fimicolochytrium jonesii]KAI8820648.1 Alpha/Beta hydrolase protein [Fimicolochytrium jonesii]